ncbi:protein C10 isoform X1 [Natator depressus]|uniref:protein C10 isoform X1 n=1 Tax=Natator depressus TaxID=27790 RepID=UPI003EB8E3C9
MAGGAGAPPLSPPPSLTHSHGQERARLLSSPGREGSSAPGEGGLGAAAGFHCCACLSLVVLAEVIKAFGSPENAQRMEEARDNACNDMGKMLQFLLPVATQIQQDVIKAYGFSNDGEGVLKFARLIKSYESQDPEIANMSGKLKAMFLPPMTLPPHGAGTGGVAAS